MTLLFRLAQTLRRGARKQRMQAWAGLLLVAASVFVVVFVLWKLVIVLVLFVVGVFLLRRSLRESQSSSSS